MSVLTLSMSEMRNTDGSATNSRTSDVRRTIPGRIFVGQCNSRLSGRRIASRRWCRAEHLAPLRPHAGISPRRRHGRHRLRSLSPLGRRRRANATPRTAGVPLQRFVEQDSALWHRRGEWRRFRFLRSARRCLARESVSSRSSRSITGIFPQRSMIAAVGSIPRYRSGSPTTRRSCSAGSTAA